MAPRQTPDPEAGPRSRQTFSTVYLLVALGILVLIQALATRMPSREIPYNEFLKLLRDGRIERVELGAAQIVATLKPRQGAAERELVATSRLPNIDETALLKELEDRQVVFAGVIEAGSWWQQLLLAWFLPALGLGLIYWFALRNLGRGAGPLSFGRSRAKIYDRSQGERATFTDVAGVDEAEAELEEIVSFLKEPKRYRALGARIPKGVLLVGPPGTGKTLLARAVAGEADVAFFSLSGSDFVEMFVGVGAARMRDLFNQGKERAPCIIFIDELDAIGRSRAGVGAFSTHDEREQTLNQLLVEMDGFASGVGVVIMAATNRPEVLDPALLRAGRFDRQVMVDRPDVRGREAILRVHVRKIPLAPDADLRVIAQRTPGMVGADLANAVNEAALAAARRGAASVGMADFEEAIDRIQLGLKKRGTVMNPEEKRRVAHHEAGHALVALSVTHSDPVHRVTIIPRSIGALGATLQLPTEDRYLMTHDELRDRLCVLLGGRVAEELVFGDVSTGAQDDLERATEIARQMVCRFGMSPQLGPVTYGPRPEARFLRTPFGLDGERTYSEETARAIDADVRGIIAAEHRRAHELLDRRRDVLERIAQELLLKETLERGELEELARRTAHVDGREPVPR